MAPTLLAWLVGFGVPYLVGLRIAQRYPSWVGVAVSLGIACAAGVVALYALAFVAGFLVEQSDALAWLNGLARGIWAVFVGAAVGAFLGRRRAAMLRTAEAELARMKGAE